MNGTWSNRPTAKSPPYKIAPTLIKIDPTFKKINNDIYYYY